MKAISKKGVWLIIAVMMLSIFLSSCGVKTLSVKFDLNYTGAGAATVVSVDEGDTVSAPESPVRKDYEFLGWFTEATTENEYDFSKTVESDITLFAGWEAYPTVIFNLNYTGAPEAEAVSVKKGTAAAEPAEPRRDGFSFGGWYTDESCTFPYEFNAVNESITVYAKWLDNSVKYITVTFNLNYSGAEQSFTQNVPENTKVQKPNDPSRPDSDDKKYVFSGWYTDPETTNEYNFETTLASPVTLYAKWVASYDFWTVYTDLSNFMGNSWLYMDSYPDYMTIERTGIGNSSQKSWDTQGHIADYFLQGVHNTYEQELVWVIESDADATAVLQMSMALEIVRQQPVEMYSSTDIDVYGGSHRIVVNGEDVAFGKYTEYDAITLWRPSADVPMQFSVYTMAEIKLIKGKNVIKFMIGVNDWLEGVDGAQPHYGSAPTIELIRLNTTAGLSWTPKLENITNRAALEDGF